MKKNKKTYLLLILVFSIWGFLGFRIVNTINPPLNDMALSGKEIKFTPPSITKRDTFSILANYRDPFLGTLPIKKQLKKTIGVVQQKEKKQVNIFYTGFVKENSTGAKIFFVSIDGEQRMLSKNDSFKDVKLLSGNNELIKVRVAGKNKSIPISE